MSRVFDNVQTGSDETYFTSPANVVYDDLSAISISVWVYPTARSDYASIIAKDPANAYQNYIALLADGTIYTSLGGLSTTGKVTSAGVALGAAHGLGYAFNDEGTINAGNGLAVYRVFGVGALGVVTGVKLKEGTDSNGEDGYSLANGVPTIVTSGTGNGALTVNITQISQTAAVSETNDAVALNTWSNIVVTWDSAGDKKVHVYVNGVEATYNTHTASDGVSADSTGGFWLGNDAYDEGLTGRIAEVAVFNSALTAGQAAAIANSTSGVPGSPVAYWHLCGLALPEPDASGNGNVMTASTNVPTKGGTSPGYHACTTASSNTVGVGAYGGNSLAEAFYNPQQLDLLQVVNEGGEIVWNLTFDGTANDDPASPTANALLGIYEGESFALAFPNPYSKDVLQIIGPGEAIVFWVDSTGAANTA